MKKLRVPGFHFFAGNRVALLANQIFVRTYLQREGGSARSPYVPTSRLPSGQLAPAVRTYLQSCIGHPAEI